MGTEVMGMWSTWEELLLGGAVVRYGTRDWNVVAAELRARAVCPYSFTAEVCKAKYEDLQQRYAGCKAWFEELRKKRMEELKRDLELSEGSIGSLESKLESLRAKKAKKDDCHYDYTSGNLESTLPVPKLERVESFSKEMSKDGLSAGSFTHETRENWSNECHIPATMSAEEIETKPEISRSSELGKVSSMEMLARNVYGGQGACIRKRRGKRKRKDCSKHFMESSIGESELLNSGDVVSHCKETSRSDCGEIARSSGANNHIIVVRRDGVDYLTEILNSILENKGASAFRRRLDSQKRGKYKKMIRKHMDFDTIRSRIGNQIIHSAAELFRDLLLLANNALVFYSKSTREYKSALLLRGLITSRLEEEYKHWRSRVTSANASFKAPIGIPPAKPRSTRLGNPKLPAEAANISNAASMTSNVTIKSSNLDSPRSVESLPVKKKGFGQPRKGRAPASQKPATPMKGKKRVGIK